MRLKLREMTFYPRYGKIRLRDLIFPLSGTIFIGLLGAIVATTNSLREGVCVICLSIGLLINLLHPYWETYSIVDRKIFTRFLWHKYTIELPPETIMLITEADIHVKLTGYQSYFLRNQYAISLIRPMPLEQLLSVLQRPYPYICTNSSIEQLFKSWQILYSFVANQQVIDAVLENTNATIIIPKSIVQDVKRNYTIKKDFLIDSSL